MFLGRKNQCCENDDTTKCNLQIQCDSYQITNGIFHRTRTKSFTIHTEMGWDGEGGVRGFQDGKHMYTRGGVMSMYGKTTPIL